MGWVDWAIATGIFIVFFAFTFSYVNQQFLLRGELPELFSIKEIALQYLEKFFSLGEPEDWSSANFEVPGLMIKLYKLPILLEEKAGLARQNETIDLRLTLDEDCELRAWESTLRLLDSDGKEIPFDLYNQTYCNSSYLKQTNLVFFAQLEANSSKFYFLYFSEDKQILAPNYTSDLSYANQLLQNSKLKLNLTGEVEELYNKQTNSQNLLQATKLGILQYNATTGLTSETNSTSGSPVLLLDSEFKKVVQVSGTTQWFDYKLNVTLYAWQPFFLLESWVRQKQDTIVNKFNNPGAELYSSFEFIAFRNQTGVFTSQAERGNVANASWIAGYNSTGVDSLALLNVNFSQWKQAGWQNFAREISFSHVANQYDSSSLSIAAGQEFRTFAYVFPFKASDHSQVDELWKKLSNPVSAQTLPPEKFLVISFSKLKELKKIPYEEAVKSLGGFDFQLEIAKD